MIKGYSDNTSLLNVPSNSDHEANKAFKVKKIQNIEPLCERFNGQPQKLIPDALDEALFGQQELPKDEAELHARASALPSMHTYAILDAAKVFGLPELLASSGLQHRCLFKGEAYDDLKDVGPWIVRLEKESDFIGKLFTEGKAPWCMWDKEPGIYIRSCKSLDELWKHFRKFTRIQDEDGKWFFNRFYDGVFWTALTDYQKCQNNDLLISLTDSIESLVFHHSYEKCLCALYPPKRIDNDTPLPKLNKGLVFAFSNVVNKRRESLDADYTLKNSNARDLDRNTIVKLREWLIKQGFRETKHIREALVEICKRNLFYEEGKREKLYKMLADKSRGVGIRIWHLKNRNWNEDA